jgi:hypothetical protein
MAITPKINPNFENVGSIRVVSNSGFEKAMQENSDTLLFGGYGYSANINVNDGSGYEITINVISKDGEYTISEKDLNATAGGAKNIQIGNFIFYDFFLTAYSIQKEVQSSVLVLTYKDKSIFMDKLYIGLLHNDYGYSFYKENNITKELKPTSIFNKPEQVKFNYNCDKNQKEITQEVYLNRDLLTVRTLRDPKEFATRLNPNNDNLIKQDLVDSQYFYSQYNYKKDGVNGGYIILGSEEFKESPCEIRDVSYNFKDLLSALFYSNVPGIDNLKLPATNNIFKKLRKNYFGSLRSVLSNWATDLGMRFYYQPKIQYKTRNYSDLNLPPSDFITIPEGVKYLDVNSGAQSLKNLNDFLNGNDGKVLKKVIQNISETATLEGTAKSSVITSIRRGARYFPNSVENIAYRTANPLPLSTIPALFDVVPNDDTFIYRSALGKYDEDLRDAYAINFISNIQNQLSLGISGYTVLFNGDSNFITNNLDFLALFGPDIGTNITNLLDNYICILAKYDSVKHDTIKQWEKAVIEEFYNQYYAIDFSTDQQKYCGTDYNYSVQYETEPPSQRYSANELPFKNLLFSKSELTKSASSTGSSNGYSNKKTAPLFQVNNPFADTNEESFKNYKSSFGDENTYSTKKTLKIIDLAANASARNALLLCTNPSYFIDVYNYINQSNIYIILCPRFNSSLLGNISVVPDVNPSILNVNNITSEGSGNNSSCQKTICEQSIDDAFCAAANPQDKKDSFYTGFITSGTSQAIRLSRVISDVTYNYNLILPTSSPYRYLIRRRVDSTTTYAAQNYVLGSLPKYPSDPKSGERLDYNVLSYSVIRNPVPEILTQIESSAGIQDQIVTFDDASGNRAQIVDALSFHDTLSKEINNSITTPHQTKSFSLISTYIPVQLKSYIFDNPILASMSFSLGNDGFNSTFNFQSRQREPKPLDSIYQTQQFLNVL